VNTFTLRLLDAGGGEDIDGVISFVGEDGSGSFGLLAGHARLLAVLGAGLSRFRRGAGPWRYLAAPGAVVHFADNVLTFCTRRYFLGDDAEVITHSLEQQMQEESQLHLAIANLRQMEQDMLKRLWEMGRRRSAGLGATP